MDAYRKKSTNNHVCFLRIDIKICCNLQCLIKLGHGTISHTVNCLHGRIILLDEIHPKNTVLDELDAFCLVLQLMQNNATAEY